MAYTVAVIGAGPDPDNTGDSDGYSMGYKHAAGFGTLENCELVACADIVREHVEAFADEYDLDERGVFVDHETMLEAVEPDIVSIAVPPSEHARLAIDCAHEGVKAVHCEKPMADTWGKSVRMAQECWRHDTQLTFNHQLRFHPVVTATKELLDDGAIGDLERIEIARETLYDSGTHQIDLANHFNDENAPAWVLGQIDYREENVTFGTHNANQSVVQWQYDNGVYGLATTGYGFDMVDCRNRLIGTEGTIEVDFTEPTPRVRLKRTGSVETFEVEQVNSINAAVEHVVSTLETDREPLVSARYALNATEIIFGAFESSRRRGRVNFPLEITDNPLEEMVESGVLEPRPSDRDA